MKSSSSRALLLTFALAAGCGSDGLPIPGGPTPGNGPGTVDLGGPSSNQPGGPTGSIGIPTPVDLGPPATGIVDLAQPGGAVGAACKTACDCQTGLGCLNGQCFASNLGKLYCCSSPICPSGGYCQDPGGGFGMCGSSGGPFPGGPDLSTPHRDAGTITIDASSSNNYCSYIPCMDNMRCKQFGCGSCDLTAGRCQ